MNRQTNILIILLALFIAVIAAYYLPGSQTEQTRSLSPNDYIQLKERKKEQRILYERERRNREIKKRQTYK
tara:strand:- start:36057 stop:36269 length:213 start_codon:yes stop_codon:yes gene_type:complete